MAEPVGGRLSTAMRATYQEAGVSQTDIADALNTDQPTVSRWARGMRRPPLDALPVIERLCGVPLGTILRRAGYVEYPAELDTEQAIRSDPRLGDESRTTLLHLYAVLTHRDASATPAPAERGTAAAAAG